MKTSKGRIVSRKKHAAGKKAIQRLFKAGYKPTKGTFTAMRKGMRTTRRKGMRGGDGESGRQNHQGDPYSHSGKGMGGNMPPVADMLSKLAGMTGNKQ